MYVLRTYYFKKKRSFFNVSINKIHGIKEVEIFLGKSDA